MNNNKQLQHPKRTWIWRTVPFVLSVFRICAQPADQPLANRVVVDGAVYATSPYNRVVALNPETGVELWSYDPKSYVDGQPPNGTGYTHRGIAVWRGAHEQNQSRDL